MSSAMDYLGDLDPDDPRTPSQQIANKLRAAILTRKVQPGEKLPSQNELAKRYGIARETVKAALRILDHERLIVSRQGSGAYVRAQTERPVGLRPHIEGAFERAHVSVDFAGFTGETLYNTLAEILDKVRAGRLTPESLTLRVLISDTTAPLVLPCRVDTQADDPAVRKRSDRITRRSIDSLIDAVSELEDLGLIRSASVIVRVHRLAPLFKLYVLNNEEAFFGFYPVIKHTVRIDGDSVDICDVMGKDATLFHYSVGNDETSNSPQFVEQARAWFESVWNSVASEYQP
ncbi:MAG: GntR family transcriptional regulator [Streptosporangiales bacterium]|nr:GntR family transcriptional regulator [Streptosporangiales bacterium]